MTEPSYIIVSRTSGRRLAAARDAIEAEGKAQAREAVGQLVAIERGVPFRPVPGPFARPDVPAGYEPIRPRPLAVSTLRQDPARWRREAAVFPEDWDRWGDGHLTINVAYGCLDRGLIEMARPKDPKSRSPYLFRRKPSLGGDR